jgi:hypothetical protein
MKVTCTVLRRGKSVMIYLFQLGTLLVYSVNDVYYRPKHKVGERSKCSNIPQQQYIRKDENEKARRFPRP